MPLKPLTKYAVALVVIIVVIFAAVFVVPGLLRPAPSGPSGPSQTIIVGSHGGAFDQALEEVSKNFTAQTNIQVRVVNVGGSLAELPKVLAGDSGIDVWASGETAIVAAANAGALAPLDNLTNVTSMPDSLRVKINGTTYAAAYASSVYGLAYNTNAIPTPPATWQEYIKMVENGSIKGKVGIFGAQLPGDGAIITQMALVAGADEHNVTAVWPILKAMAPHIGYIYQGAGPMTSAMASGDLVAMAPAGVTIAFSAYQSGAPVRFKILGGATPLLDNDPIVVLKGPNQKAALDFVNYCLSPGPDSILAKIGGNFPTNPQSTFSPDSLNFLGISPNIIYTSAHVPDWAYVSSHYSKWVAQWNSEIQPLINTS